MNRCLVIVLVNHKSLANRLVTSFGHVIFCKRYENEKKKENEQNCSTTDLTFMSNTLK